MMVARSAVALDVVTIGCCWLQAQFVSQLFDDEPTDSSAKSDEELLAQCSDVIADNDAASDWDQMPLLEVILSWIDIFKDRTDGDGMPEWMRYWRLL